MSTINWVFLFFVLSDYIKHPFKLMVLFIFRGLRVN